MNPLISSKKAGLFLLGALIPLSLLNSSSAEQYFLSESEQLKQSSCSINIDQELYRTTAGSELLVEWNMSGEESPDVFVSVFTAEGNSYILSTMVSNTGRHSIKLPSELAAHQAYTVYIESADNKERSMNCWDHARLELIEPSCSLDIDKGLHVVTQDTVSIDWNMSGFQTDHIYLSIFFGSGDVYLLNTIEPNTGSYEWSVPSWLDSERIYSVYIEDAHNGRRGTHCWDHSELIVSAS